LSVERLTLNVPNRHIGHRACLAYLDRRPPNTVPVPIFGTAQIVLRNNTPKASPCSPHCLLPEEQILRNRANSRSENLRKYDRFVSTTIQRGARECQAWNESIYLAAIIRLRLRHAEI